MSGLDGVPPATQFAKADGLSIAYQVAGSGPVDVVVVPGFMSHVELNWEYSFTSALLHRLERFARFVVFDKRGSGLSDRSVGAGTMEDRVEEVTAVMDAAGLERGAVVGLSNGAPVATVFAATHPERVSSLVLAMATCPGVLPIDAAFEGVLHLVEEYWNTGLVLDAVVQHASDSGEAVRRLARYERYSCTPSVAATILRHGRQADITPFLPLVEARTLAIHHRDDPITPLREAEHLAAHIPRARLEVLDGDFHLSWRPTDYDPMMQLMQEFLTGRPAEPYRPRPSTMSTVLFTDIVDSTGLVSELGDRRWAAVLDEYIGLCADAVGRCGGTFVKETGDGMLAYFDRPSAAVSCAVESRERAAALGLRTRAGVHVGEVEHRRTDISGLAVHVAARVVESAPPGEVIVSRAVRDLTTGGPRIRYEAHDERVLRGLRGTWALFRATTD